jgi:hypothetical protein
MTNVAFVTGLPTGLKRCPMAAARDGGEPCEPAELGIRAAFGIDRQQQAVPHRQRRSPDIIDRGAVDLGHQLIAVGRRAPEQYRREPL